MTYFPLHQTTCFFIPLVAPCKPLLISSKPQNYFQKGDQIRFWDSYPTEQERDTAPWGRREKP